MLVYRIEEEDGTGFYRGHHYNSDCLTDIDGPYCLGPSRDGIKEYRGNYRFGFESMQLLNDWFILPELRKLQVFYLSIYRVNRKHVLFGKRQVTFDATKATKYLPLYY